MFLHTFCVLVSPPILTMIHLCITQCTYCHGTGRPCSWLQRNLQ